MSRPWGKYRDGFIMGEGVGVLVMESLEHAMKRGPPIIVEYLGGEVTCDAYHMTDPCSDGLGVSMCIRKDLEDAGVSPKESMIGHPLGDADAPGSNCNHKGYHYQNTEPDVMIDIIPNVKKRHEVHVGISNSFGFGGHKSVVDFAPFNP